MFLSFYKIIIIWNIRTRLPKSHLFSYAIIAAEWNRMQNVWRIIAGYRFMLAILFRDQAIVRFSRLTEHDTRMEICGEYKKDADTLHREAVTKEGIH